MRPSLLFLLAAPLVACGPAEKRQLDERPVETTLTNPLPPDKAEASFLLDSAGDRLDFTRRETGLILVVRYGNKELRQAIASCREARFGRMRRQTAETTLEAVACDGRRYWLITEDGSVLVQEGTATKRDRIVTRITLPPGIDRAVRLQFRKGPGG